MSTPIAWPEAQRICDIPEIHEALSTFSHDSTEDNAVGLISAVLKAVATFTQGRAAGLEEALNIVENADFPDGFSGHALKDAIDARISLCLGVAQSPMFDEKVIGHLLPCAPELTQTVIDGQRYCFSGAKELSGHPALRAKAIALYARSAIFPTSSDAGKDDARDTERLDWLNQRGQTFGDPANETPNGMTWTIGGETDDLREAIDDAMARAALSSLEAIGKGEKG